MENFNVGVWNRLTLQGEHIAGEFLPTLQNHRRWIAIYKLKLQNPLSEWENSVYKYKVLDFELAEDLVEEYFGEEDKKNNKQLFANSEEELIRLFKEQNIDVSQLTYPWKCDYPL